MALSALFRVIGCFGMWNDPVFAPTQIALPLACNLLFIVFLVFFGKRALWMTSFPFSMGSAFFILKSFATTGIFGKVVCVLLYVSAAVIYISTTSGWLKTKWLLLLLLMSIFVYYIAVEDLRVFTNPLTTVTFSTVMQEISAVFIILAFLFTVFAMKNRRPLEECDLPKMKAPKIFPHTAEKKTTLADEAAKQEDSPKNGSITAETLTDAENNKPEEKTGTGLLPTEPSEK